MPGDKSISHRALLVGALAAGTTEIAGLSKAGDVGASARALRALRVGVRTGDGGTVQVDGVGAGGLARPDDVIDCGNSGTTARLLLGILAGHPFPVVLTGDASLRRRPMGRVADPLRAMGARFEAPGGPRLPLTVTGSRDLVPLAWESPVASAQVKTAVLLAGLHARGETSVREPRPSRDHGERMLRRLGARVRTADLPGGGAEAAVTGGGELAPCRLEVPGDMSAAAFVLAAAALVPGSEVEIEGVGVNPLRTGALDALRAMGADVRVAPRGGESGEPVADLAVRAPAGGLRACDLGPEEVPRTVDEYPALAVAAAFADGESRFQGLAELRVKESDRLEAMRAGLEAAGVRARIEGDDLLVEGAGQPAGGARIDAALDHRIAMAFLVLGAAAREPMEVRGAEAIATSWPGFAEAMRGLGADVAVGPGGA